MSKRKFLVDIEAPNLSGANTGDVAPLSGTTVQRLLATTTPVGVSFWDTDLKIPCYLEGIIWYNSAGGVVE
jgi:hypothetical protein